VLVPDVPVPELDPTVLSGNTQICSAGSHIMPAGQVSPPVQSITHAPDPDMKMSVRQATSAV
jgi:hypothetical protein